MAVSIPTLKQRFEVLRSDRSQEEIVWDEIEKYILPLSGQTAQAVLGGSVQSKTDVQLWDLTAPLAAEHLASSLQADVTSPSAKWLDFEWQDAELEKDHDAIAYREQLADLVWSELQASDFNMEIASGYLEWAGLGNMALVVEAMSSGPEWKGLDFTAVPIRQVWFEEDSRGAVYRWWRMLKWTPVQAVDFCEREKNADGSPKHPAPERLRKAADADDGHTRKIDVVFCVFRRPEVKEDLEGEALPELRPFGAVYFTLEDAEQLGPEGGYYKMPANMGRWAKRPGSVWGFGRGHIALRHVKWLNAFKELQRNAAEKAVDPTLGVSERVGTPLDLRPGRVNVAPSKDDIWPIESGARFDVSAEVMRDERIEVRRAFHEDDLQLKESPQMTATEVQARKDQMNRAIGSPVGRLQTDVLQPIVMIVLDLLGRARRLPTAPESVRAKRAEVKLRFRGPVARAQVMDEVVAIEREAGFVSNLLKLGFEEARYFFDVGNAIREHAKRLGVPIAVLNSPEQAKKAMDQEARARMAERSAAVAKDRGQAMAAAASAQGAIGAGAPGIAEQPALAPTGAILP